jgi:hypothetical protein
MEFRAIHEIGAKIRAGFDQLIDDLSDRIRRSEKTSGHQEVRCEPQNPLSALPAMSGCGGREEPAEPAMQNLLDILACRLPRADTGGYIGLRETDSGRDRPHWLRVIPGGHKGP